MALINVILYLLCWSVIGFLAAKFLKVPKSLFSKLHKLTFNLILPIFILLSITQHFNMSFFIQNMGIAVAHIIFLSLGFFNLLLFNKNERKYAFTILSFQNSAYLPLPIILAMENNNEVLLLLFMFLVGFNLSMFTLGYWVLNRKSSLTKLLNPPLVSTLLAIAISIIPNVFPELHPTCIKDFISSIYPYLQLLRQVIRQILIPLILFIFGGTLAYSSKTKSLFKLSTHIKLALIKFIEFPIIIYLLFANSSKVVLTIMLLESIVPPAMNLILLPSKESDMQKISNLLLIQYLFFIVIVVPVVLLWSIYS